MEEKEGVDSAIRTQCTEIKNEKYGTTTRSF